MDNQWSLCFVDNAVLLLRIRPLDYSENSHPEVEENHLSSERQGLFLFYVLKYFFKVYFEAFEVLYFLLLKFETTEGTILSDPYPR